MQYQPPSDWDNEVAMALLACALASIALLAMTFYVFGADNQPDCMTREQARAAYPNQALYWRTAKHCWYGGQTVRNVSSREKTARPARPARPARSAPSQPKIKTVRWNDYNELDAAADRDTYFDANAMPAWRAVPIPRSRFLPWDQRIGL
jgi:hypothetical protein